MWSFRFGLLFICDSSSIKVAPLLYYTSVLISTKITTIFSLWDPHYTQLRGLTKLKDQDCLRAQHTSWSLVLLPGQIHRTFAFPSEALATSWICIKFLCRSVLNSGATGGGRAEVGRGGGKCYQFILISKGRDCLNIFYWSWCLYAALNYVIDMHELQNHGNLGAWWQLHHELGH